MSLLDPFKEGDELVTDHQQIANILNSFFCSVFTKEDMENMPEMEPQ